MVPTEGLNSFSTIDLASFPLNFDAVACIPRALAMGYDVLALSVEGLDITVAMADINDADTVDRIKLATGMRVRQVHASRQAIREKLTAVYQGDSHEQPSGDRRQQVIERYAYLCARGAKKFLRRCEDREDLEQVAMIGLIKAADKFDPSLSTPFEAYAWLFIIGELMHYVRDHERIVRPPRKLRALEPKWVHTQDKLSLALGRDPTLCEIAHALDVDVVTVRELIRCRESALPRPLEAVDNDFGAAHAATQCGGDAQIDRLLVEAALRALNDLERTVILAVYAQGYTQSELAKRLGYSQRHISRLHRTALSKMLPSVVLERTTIGH
ncbi:MAG: sigma-70 family RNA polymerase sigma factor [Candidatus Eremiobacteraeota bacterium]|nr:sigma-70 family RNA polymerase sigma factor [Candidatus Eremiobacteraeota bacterium]